MNTDTRSFLKISSGVAGIVTLFAILAAVNLLIRDARVRLDFTQEKLYTLSDGTRQILAKLDQPVTLKLFFNQSSPDVPAYLKTYAKQVKDLLQEYRLASGSKLTIEFYDPKPDSDAEEWAQRYGLSGQSVNMFSPPMFCGLVAVAGNTQATLPFLDPRTQDLLEYSLTRLIYQVTHAQKPVIGVLSSLKVLGEQEPGYMPTRNPKNRAWLIFESLKEDYTLQPVETTATEISPEISTLVVVHPKNLPDKTLFAIDQFLLRGGRLMVFTDPFSVTEMETSETEPYGRPSVSSDLKKLFTAWGVTFNTEKVVADMRAITQLVGGNNTADESPIVLSLTGQNFNKKDILTSSMNSVLLPVAGSFSCQAGSNLTVTPLITTSPMGGEVDTYLLQMGSAGVRRNFKPAPAPLDLAIRLTGTFKTAFPDGQPRDPAETNAAAQAAAPALQEGSSSVILIGDADMLYNRFCIDELPFFGAAVQRPKNDNVNFFLNAIEQLSGSSDLIGIRSRGRFDRPFGRVDALEEKAREAWQVREEMLVQELQRARQQLAELQDQKDQSQKQILSKEQKEAIARFRMEEIRINRQLKDVRKNLRSDIEQLGYKVKFINLALMPICISLVGIVAGFRRKRRR
jgi:ABC-type uncharacterized transport system involved in gliding motility auxiliary subunit